MSRYHSDKTGFPMLTGQAPSADIACITPRMVVDLELASAAL